jgi:hypothetical protein
MLGNLNCYVARLSVFLIMVTLIAGMVGCGPTQYKLTISSNEGGQVTIPGEDTFTYEEKGSVDLVAQAEEGYQFVNWTGNVTTIASVNAAITTITVNGDYYITANFAPEISENLEIWDWYDLNAIRDNLGGSYILMNDLDSTTAGYEELVSPTAKGGAGWQPIGAFNATFTGTFDGQGYKIHDLFINRPYEDDVGLFGYVSEGGVIKNLGVVNTDVTGLAGVGGLIGENAGTVSNSYSTGNVTDGGWGWVGGLIGGNAGTVSNSYSTSYVTGYAGVGGLVAFNDEAGTVSNSYSSANVMGEEIVGGLVAGNAGIVSNSYSTGSVTGNNNVGGLVGENHGTVNNSFWDIETSGQATSDGGTGKHTTEMHDIATFSGAGWNMIAVGGPSERNPTYIWNIVNGVTYPFLSWQS